MNLVLLTYNGASHAAQVYTPSSPTQWRTENVDMSSYAGKQVYLRFIGFNQHGNHLYLANINVTNTVLASRSALAESAALQAFPNPVAGGQQLTLSMPTVAGEALVRVVDGLGRAVSQRTITLNATTNTRCTLTAPLASGLYTVLCQTADGQLYSRHVAID